MDEADIVIVGAGSAGAVLAARLSEDPAVRVALVEAGDDTPPGRVPPDIADTFPRSYSNRDYAWPGLEAHGVVGAAPRPFTQARVMGGGSSLMGMWAIRGLPADYDAWAAAGARGWAWADVLPYFRRLEKDLDQGGPLHGDSGPVPIRRIQQSDWPGFLPAFAAAAAARGIALHPDINTATGDGLFAIPLSQDGPQRASSASAYLTAAVRARRNLAIMPQTRVTELEFAGRSVRGVRARRTGQEVFVRAREVVLCAGGIHSPCLLMRSGIGPAEALRSVGISPRCDRPGVGRNLQNHVYLHFGMTVAPGARQGRHLRHYGIVCARVSSGLPGCPPSDLLLFVIGRLSTRPFGTRVGMVGAAVYAPFSRGQVRLNSAHADDPPQIDFRLLDDPRDGERMAMAANLAADLLRDDAMSLACPEAFLLPADPPLQRLNRPGWWGALQGLVAAGILELPAPLRRLALRRLFGAERMLPGPGRPLPPALVRASALPMFHPAGTCAIGATADAAAVVDSSCRVLGVEGVRVVDASIMPTIPRANTHLTAVMIAERAADLIRSEWKGAARQ